MRLPSGCRFDVQLSPNITTSSRSLASISSIVIHWWNAPSAGATHGGVVAWFMNRASQVSAHYTISAARVTQQVREKDIAWHARGGNQATLGLELSPYCTAGDYDAAAHVIANIWLRAGRVIRLRPHKSITRGTACPGDWDLRRLEKAAREVHKSLARGGRPAAAPTPRPAPAPSRSYPRDFTPWPARALANPFTSNGPRFGADWWPHVPVENRAALADALRQAGHTLENNSRWGHELQVRTWLQRQHKVQGLGDPRSIWRAFQRRLASQRHYGGKVDGIPGPQTWWAVTAWLNATRSQYK